MKDESQADNAIDMTGKVLIDRDVLDRIIRGSSAKTHGWFFNNLYKAIDDLVKNMDQSPSFTVSPHSTTFSGKPHMHSKPFSKQALQESKGMKTRGI